jgi:SAM-dependent methyltransferase
VHQAGDDVRWYENVEQANWSLKRYDHLYAWQARQLNRFAPGKGRLLDVGCGFGFFLSLAQRGGWEVRGVDVSVTATTYAREQLGLTGIITDELRPESFADDHFEAATLWNLLEHLDHPLATLQLVVRRLTPNGVLGLRVPNIAFYDLAHRFRGPISLLGFRHFPYLASPPPGHLYGFTPRTLRCMLEQAGVEVLKISPAPLSRLYPVLLRTAATAAQGIASAVSLGRLNLGPTLVAWARKKPGTP